jgi:DNA mismatch repair ATPase MutS
MNPEKALFQAFAVPNKRQRYINLLDSNGGREKIRLSLDHFKDLDPRFARRVNPGEQNLIDLLRILRGLEPQRHVTSSPRTRN